MLQPLPYQNPFALLGINPDESLDPASLRRARKRLIAEWELQDAAERQDKTELLKLLEQLESEAPRSHHLFVIRFESLLSFLEEGKLDFFSPENQQAFSQAEGNGEAFREFLAPYFAFRFNQALLKAFKSQDWDDLKALGEASMPVDAVYYPLCYKDMAQHLQFRIEEVESLAKETDQGKTPGPEIQEPCDEWLITGLNFLPSYFDGLRNRYAQALETLALAVHNQHARSSLAKFIIRQGLKLRISEETRGSLQHVLDQLLGLEPDGGMEDFTENARQGFQRTFRKVKGWQIALGVVIGAKLLFLLLRAIIGG